MFSMDPHIHSVNFSEASREGDIVVLRRCTRKDVNKLDNDGMSPVHWAALYGRIEALKILTGKGGNPDRLNTNGSTALHLAASAGQLHCLVFLTNYGCNIYAINDNGATAMQEAVNNGRIECVRHIESLVTHQVSQDKSKVEKMQLNARKDAEKRIKEKTKLLSKIDKKSKQLHNFGVRSTSVDVHAPTKNMSVQPFHYPQMTRLPPSDGASFDDEGGAMAVVIDNEGSESFNRSVDDIDVNFSSFNNTMKMDESSELSESSKNIPLPSNSSSLKATLQSLHTNDAFIASGSFTNVSLQDYQGPLPATIDPQGVAPQGCVGVDVHAEAADQPIRTVGNVPPSKRVGEPVGVVEISMGPLYTFLHSLQMDEFRDLFLREKIDLRACALCNESDLREIGLPVGSRKKFLEATSKRNHVLRSGGVLVDSAV